MLAAAAPALPVGVIGAGSAAAEGSATTAPPTGSVAQNPEGDLLRAIIEALFYSLSAT